MDDLRAALLQAIGEFNENRNAIIQLAYAEGGQARVREAEEQYDSLRNVYSELLQARLDQNNALYVQLSNAARVETVRLRTSVGELQHINDIITALGALIAVIGRIITTLAA